MQTVRVRGNTADDHLMRRFQTQLDALAAQWLPLFGLSAWDIVFELRDTECPDDTNRLAETETQWEYCCVKMTFYVPTWSDLSPERAELAFVHECCHALTEEAISGQVCEEHDAMGKHVERVVTHLSQAFLRTAQHARPVRFNQPVSTNGEERAAVPASSRPARKR